MNILGISRSEEFSSGCISDDFAIFLSVTGSLEKRGHRVITISEQELLSKGIPEGCDAVFHMVRSEAALGILEQASIPVVNSVRAVRNCGRAAQTRLLQGTGLIPESLVCAAGTPPDGWNRFPCWVKRGDIHALTAGDIKYVTSADECAAQLAFLAERGIVDCVIQKHVPGWVAKFYGVRGSGVLDCQAAFTESAASGQECYNDTVTSPPVDMRRLTEAVLAASDILGVDVYGGDAVIGRDGAVTIIDFNDWPTFRTCREKASQAIADLIIGRIS